MWKLAARVDSYQSSFRLLTSVPAPASCNAGPFLESYLAPRGSTILSSLQGLERIPWFWMACCIEIDPDVDRPRRVDI
jgi:hypothetical protein